MLLRLRAIALLLLEHASAYAELGAAAAGEYRRALLRRALLFIIGAFAAVAGLAALWIGGLVALWETDWRLAYVMGSAMVMLVIAGATLYRALVGSEPGPSSGLLRSELRKDMELLQQWKGTL